MKTKRSKIQFEQKLFRKRKRWKDYKKKRNLINNSRKKSFPKTKRIGNLTSVKLPVPTSFSLLENTEVVLQFAEKCKALKKTNINRAILDFSNVIEISHGSMALMLSIVHDLNLYNISVGGIVPNDINAKEKFILSGFLDFFQTKIAPRSKHKNTILVSGSQKIDQTNSAPEIENAMETVFGKKVRNQKLQGMIIEMMTNSVNHAFIQQYRNTKWYLSIFHDENEKRVKFCFVDNGVGLFKTIRRKFLTKLVEQLTGKEVIIRAFNGEYGSRTGLTQRGTGLVTIKDNFSQNIITNLRVITNKYFYNVENHSVIELKNNFNGTFYFWELDESCKNVNY